MSEAASAIGRTAIPSACENERASRCWLRSTRKASRRPAKSGTRRVTRLWDSTTFSTPTAAASRTSSASHGDSSTPPRCISISLAAIDEYMHAATAERVDFYRPSWGKFSRDSWKEQRRGFQKGRVAERVIGCRSSRSLRLRGETGLNRVRIEGGGVYFAERIFIRAYWNNLPRTGSNDSRKCRDELRC